MKEHTVTNFSIFDSQKTVEGGPWGGKKLLHSCCYFKTVDFQSLHIIRSDGVGRKKGAPYSCSMSKSQCSLQRLTFLGVTEVCLM